MLALLARSCDGGVAQSCGALSAVYALGRAGEVNVAKAGELGVRACELGSYLSCLSHADDIKANPVEAYTFLVRACHIGSADGCLAAVSLVMDGRAPAGSDTVRSLVEHACMLGKPEACAYLQQPGGPP
jgi:uncharacterized protein